MRLLRRQVIIAALLPAIGFIAVRARAAQDTLPSTLLSHDQLQVRGERLFRDYGLTGAQYNILRILRG